MLTLNEQEVRWYWWMFEFECVIAWYTMHHATIAITHSPAIQLQWQWHTADSTLMLIEYMELILLALDGQEVSWYWCMFEFE